jgi:hypothetical protein
MSDNDLIPGTIYSGHTGGRPVSSTMVIVPALCQDMSDTSSAEAIPPRDSEATASIIPRQKSSGEACEYPRY